MLVGQKWGMSVIDYGASHEKRYTKTRCETRKA